MNVPRGTLFIIITLIFIILPGISQANDTSNRALLSDSANTSSGIFSTNSLTSPPFSCNIYLALTKEVNILINYCDSSDWHVILTLKYSPVPNLITTSKETIIYDPKEKKMYQANTGNKIKFTIGLFPSGDGYSFTNTIGFEKEREIPEIDIDLSSIIKASLKRDKITFFDDKTSLIAEGVHEQNNILSKTRVWTDKESRLPVKIELSQRPVSSPANSWRKLVLFENISTDCNITSDAGKDYKSLIAKSKISVNAVDENEIKRIFLNVMKDMGLSK